LTQLEHELGLWIDGVRSLGEAGLGRPCGPAEGPFADAPLAGLVLHIHRELIHHLAEVSLLRDLYSHVNHGGQMASVTRERSEGRSIDHVD
jgi:hypothetical protein